MRRNGNQAERMTHRVCEHSEFPLPTTSTPEAAGTEGGDRPLANVEVLDPNVEVHLLRCRIAWPVGGDIAWATLECHARPVRRVADYHPVGLVLNSHHAKQHLVEACELGRFRTVDHETMPSPNFIHAQCLPSTDEGRHLFAQADPYPRQRLSSELVALLWLLVRFLPRLTAAALVRPCRE